MPNLAEQEYCTGCTACASACPRGCITMASDENGFLSPVIDTEKCVSCSLCEKACPIITPLSLSKIAPKAYAAYSKDEAVRMQSSSGGIFTEIAKTVLADGGAVYGAAYNAQFEVVHICAETEVDLAKLRGAKYAQSDLRGIFTNVKAQLEQGRKVLFSGTPCQVAGLKSFLQKDYVNLLLVDFVCHSVPSPMAWQAYVKYRAEQDNEGKLPKSINLRAKISGWSRYRYSNLFTYTDGSVHCAVSGESLYMKLFGGGYLSRKSCEHCQFKGYSRVSDLTLGDFWGIWDIHPEMDDNKGTSVVLVHSQQGKCHLEQISDQLLLKPVTQEEASCQNPAMIQSMRTNPGQLDALQQIREGKIGDCSAWFAKAEPIQKPGVLSLVRRLFSRFKRIIRRRKQ